jgi:transketolase
MASPQQWNELAQQLRVDSIRSTTEAGSGHPTSSMSGADLLAVLLYEHLCYDFANPANPSNDHLIFSKGHAAPLLYAAYKAVGAISDEEMMTLRKFGSRIEGHPVPVLPYVDVATGSLGQGLPIGVGIALAGKFLDKLPYRVWVVLGDSEMAEGSIYEALALAGHHKLGGLIGILDMNRLGQRGETMLGWNGEAYAARARAFGWRAIQVDGHDLNQIHAAYGEAAKSDTPTLVVAKTIKGKGFAEIEDRPGWHGKPLPRDVAERAIRGLGGVRNIRVDVRKPKDVGSAVAAAPGSKTDGTSDAPTLTWSKPAAQVDRQAPTRPAELPSYKGAVATRQAYGEALKALGAVRPNVVAVDGEVSNSTFAELFAKAYPERYFEQYIAEQQMVASAIGLGVRGYAAFASTFAAFFSRAYDFIRMAAISRANIKLSGSHAGVSIGQDGPSQMALEDLAIMRAVHGSVVFYPSDANQTAKLVELMADHHGISYLRTTREKTPVIYDASEQFSIGGCKVVRQSDSDKVTIVGAGVTLHEAVKAHDQLKADGTAVRVIDAYSVKPIDASTLHDAARATGGKVVVVEDHWPEGGLGDAVLEAFSRREGKGYAGALPVVVKLGVRDMPTSGSPEELMDAAGITAKHIVSAVKSLVG